MKGFEDSDRRAGRIPLHERIRNLRHKLGITGYELAERAGISPSYVSLIEKGLKVPHPEVAIRIARVLGDDEDLYAAWARSARHGDLPGARRAVEAAGDIDVLLLDTIGDLSVGGAYGSLLALVIAGCIAKLDAQFSMRSVGYRLIYRVDEDLMLVTVIAVGKRDKQQVYDAAPSRL